LTVGKGKTRKSLRGKKKGGTGKTYPALKKGVARPTVVSYLGGGPRCREGKNVQTL